MHRPQPVADVGAHGVDAAAAHGRADVDVARDGVVAQIDGVGRDRDARHVAEAHLGAVGRVDPQVADRVDALAQLRPAAHDDLEDLLLLEEGADVEALHEDRGGAPSNTSSKRVHNRAFIEGLFVERLVGGAKGHRLGLDLLDAAAGADRLIVETVAGLFLVGVGPFRIDRIGEGSACPRDIGRLGRGYGKRCGEGRSCRIGHEPHCCSPCRVAKNRVRKANSGRGPPPPPWER